MMYSAVQYNKVYTLATNRIGNIFVVVVTHYQMLAKQPVNSHCC